MCTSDNLTLIQIEGVRYRTPVRFCNTSVVRFSLVAQRFGRQRACRLTGGDIGAYPDNGPQHEVGQKRHRDEVCSETVLRINRIGH